MNNIKLIDLIKKGFSIQCVTIHRACCNAKMLFKLSHNDHDSIYFIHDFGDGEYCLQNSVNLSVDFSTLSELNDRIYAELVDFGHDEIYDALVKDEESEQMKKSNQRAITILTSVFE